MKAQKLARSISPVGTEPWFGCRDAVGVKLVQARLDGGGCSVLSSSRSVLGRGPRHAIRTSLRYRLDLFRFLVSILIGRTSNVEWLLGDVDVGGGANHGARSQDGEDNRLGVIYQTGEQ